MALQKQPVPLNFAQGLDTKTDSKQVKLGKFLELKNSVFDKIGQLTKRNGYPLITTIPDANQTTLTTLNDNLTATGSNLYAYSKETSQWLNRGTIQPVTLSTTSLVRVSTSQTAPDAAIAPSGLTCLVYLDNGLAYYQVSDSSTGQQIVSRTALPATATSPRVTVLGSYFVVTFMATVGGIPHLQYIAIPMANPSNPGFATDISAVVESLSAGYDVIVVNNNLYAAWSASSTTVRIAYLTSTLIVSSSSIITGKHASLVSLSADLSSSTATIWLTYWDSVTTNGYSATFSSTLTPILASTQVIVGEVLAQITSIASSVANNIYYELISNYTGTSIRSDYIKKVSITPAGTVSFASTVIRSVGLASKPFIGPNGTIYMLVAYAGTNQPSYFLIDSLGNIIARLAPTNGGGYSSTQVLPSVSQLADGYAVPYLIKDFLASVNKGTNIAANTPVNAIYTQTGVNLVKFSINNGSQYSNEIAGSLHLTGGQLWQYDGVKPVEHGFHVYPESVQATPSTAGGVMTAQTYYYQVTYEWTDNVGNLHRSAPSLPVQVVTTGTTASVTLVIPSLRLTAKTSPNPVRVVIYRWSTAQQLYYQITSITSPLNNTTTSDTVSYIDTQSDAQILGNVLLYTTGGVIENIAAPASTASALFKNRLFLVGAEDPNLLSYSKQVIENTPVEMSDLLTIYVAPTTGSQGSTGGVRALSAMDDKLIIFKKDAIYYLTGVGPDNTGASNDFIDPVYITSSVGCSNPLSIVLMSNGLMFQSDKGIWLLGRDLSTTYIGADVEQYNANGILSAKSIPGTNQVRFVLDNGTTLMYDYFMGQWGTFDNIQAISSTLYQGADTYLNKFGQIFQEKAGTYLDGARPVLMSFKTSWVALAGIQGLERFYDLHLLGTYYSPFKLNVQMAYDYSPSASQSTLVSPDNYTPNWGGDANWGAGGNWGGQGKVFEARVFPDQQKCESFQIEVNEIYDASVGVAAGQGLALSGLLLTVGLKKGSRTSSAGRSFGSK